MMAATDLDILREKACAAYPAAAEGPQEKHAFPVGRAFAESVGYSAELLNRLPAIASDAFGGVSNVSLFADIAPGATVLDFGCGAGMAKAASQDSCHDQPPMTHQLESGRQEGSVINNLSHM
jgi:hypothetical protein